MRGACPLTEQQRLAEAPPDEHEHGQHRQQDLDRGPDGEGESEVDVPLEREGASGVRGCEGVRGDVRECKGCEVV